MGSMRSCVHAETLAVAISAQFVVYAIVNAIVALYIKARLDRRLVLAGRGAFSADSTSDGRDGAAPGSASPARERPLLRSLPVAVRVLVSALPSPRNLVACLRAAHAVGAPMPVRSCNGS